MINQKLVMLIVEDVDIIRASLRAEFCHSFEILEAENGQKAFDRLEDNRVDIILLDVFMPVMNGFEFLRKIKTIRQLSTIPIVVLTADNDSEVELEVLNLGADDIIRKPIKPQILEKRISNIINSHNVVRVEEENKTLKEVEKLKKQLQNIMNGVPGSILRVWYKHGDINRKTGFEYVNDGFYELRGLQRNDMTTDIDISVGVVEEDFQFIQETLQDAIDNKKEKVQYSFHIRRVDGDLRYVESNVAITYQGDDVYTDIIENDVTDLRKLSNKLAQLENQYENESRNIKTLLDFVPCGVAIFKVTDEGVSITYVNEALASLLGYEREEYIKRTGQNAFIDIHPNDISIVKKSINKAKVRNGGFSETFRNKTYSGEYIWITLKAIIIERSSQEIIAYGAYSDVSELKGKAEKDALTKIYNRQAFEDIVKQELGKNVNADKEKAVLMIDIDNFKQINDTFGHAFGDEVLKRVARKITKVFRKEDIIARLGGDEFCVFVSGELSKEVIENRAEELRQQLELEYDREEGYVKISGSIGVSFASKDGSEYETLYKNADSAQYRVKRNGKNAVAIYDESWEKE